VKSEVELWSELGKKLSTSRSGPERLQAYRDGVAQRLQMAAEDVPPPVRGRPKKAWKPSLARQRMAERQTGQIASSEMASDHR
jgi:hypothetical protein